MQARIAEPREGATDTPFMPYRHLAIRVLASALRDVSDPARCASDRESARLFFAGSRMLFHWCRVASLDPYRFVRHVAMLTADQAGRSDGRRRAAALVETIER